MSSAPKKMSSIPTKYMSGETHDDPAKNAPANSAITGIFAPQGMNVVSIAVALLSFGLMIAGLVLFVKELRYHRDSFRLINFCPDVSQGQKIVIYLTAPVTILAFAGLIFITVRTALGLGLF